ncbi:MAG: hypothetical protein M0R47_05095 [Methylobacter sp.]|uniref:hypothetical protein n=1 Tax=Methylobacter sp. TaxID=2051955 RepID=UPI0025D23D66|nr:hypothetical protein [Methylobacter sp.]MCK9619893.1 hypothetical protein [Methylobacter sp.]
MKHSRAFRIFCSDGGKRREQKAVASSGHLPPKVPKRFILALLIFCPFSAIAANTWSYHQETDKLSNRTYSFARAPLPTRGLYDNVRLEIVCKNNALQVVIDADSLIASQGRAFDFEYQIDKNPAVKIQMKAFPDSKRRGYTEEHAKRIIDDMLSGQSIFIRVNTMIRKVLSAALPLESAAEPIKHVAADCGLSVSDNAAGESPYSLDEFEQEFANLPLEQQQQVLKQIKKIMLETQKALLRDK